MALFKGFFFKSRTVEPWHTKLIHSVGEFLSKFVLWTSTIVILNYEQLCFSKSTVNILHYSFIYYI